MIDYIKSLCVDIIDIIDTSGKIDIITANEAPDVWRRLLFLKHLQETKQLFFVC